MTSTCATGGLTDTDETVLRLFKIIKSEFRHALNMVFKWGCKKNPDESIRDYLTSDDRGDKKISCKVFDSKFQWGKKVVKKDATGKIYDVSLLWTCIRYGNDDLSNDEKDWLKKDEEDERLEALCTVMKNYRNEIVHETCQYNDEELRNLCKEFKELPEKVLKTAGDMYEIDESHVNEEIEAIKKNIDKIMRDPIKDVMTLRKEMQRLKEEQMDAINGQGKSELSERYKSTSMVDPASFVMGGHGLQVEKVFTTLEVISENRDEEGTVTCHSIDYKKLLVEEIYADERPERPKVTILEGDGGAGKTTLGKLILSDWAGHKSIFEGLEGYDLVLWCEGKSRNVSSYLKLIRSLMPMALYEFADDHLISVMLRFKVLLVMDGFDDLNAESEKLIREVLERIPESCGKLHLLITTRPSKLSDLHRLIGSHSILLTKLRGISPNKRVDYVSRLHEEMIEKGQSKQSTQKLINFMSESSAKLGEHYRLPLNLTLLTYLWATAPGKVNSETTATGLYSAFLDLIQSILLKKIQVKKSCHDMSEGKFKDDMKKFLPVLYSVCFDTLSSGYLKISDESEETLREICTQLELPFETMTEAFLVVEKEWTCSGFETYLSVPHKSLLEFYAANHFIMRCTKASDLMNVMSLLQRIGVSQGGREEIMEIINRDTKDKDTKSFREIWCELLKTPKDVAKYDNMFLYLTGLLPHEEYCEELVELMSKARFEGTKWLDVLVEAKCDKKLAALLAGKFSTSLTVRDGHTGAAEELLKHLKTNIPVEVFLENEVSRNPHLKDMLLQLSKKNCDVDFSLQYQWRQPHSGFSEDYLYCLLPTKDKHRCRLSRFTGHLKTLSQLPASLKCLWVSFDNTEHAQKLLEELPGVVNESNIECLGIHIMQHVQLDGLSPLPILDNNSRECGSLWLTEIQGDWKAKCEVIRALCPANGRFNSINFPECNLSGHECKKLIAELKKLDVKLMRTGGVRLTSSRLTKRQVMDLKGLCWNELKCQLHCMDEHNIWEIE